MGTPPSTTLTVYTVGPPLSDDQVEALADDVPRCSTRNARKVRCAGEASVLVILRKAKAETEDQGFTRLAACPKHRTAMLNWLRKQGAEIPDEGSGVTP